ncbi:hypothetical protein L9F63_006795, partial [Diploptera punctata]
RIIQENECVMRGKSDTLDQLFDITKVSGLWLSAEDKILYQLKLENKVVTHIKAFYKSIALIGKSLEERVICINPSVHGLGVRDPGFGSVIPNPYHHTQKMMTEKKMCLFRDTNRDNYFLVQRN